MKNYFAAPAIAIKKLIVLMLSLCILSIKNLEIAVNHLYNFNFFVNIINRLNFK